MAGDTKEILFWSVRNIHFEEIEMTLTLIYIVASVIVTLIVSAAIRIGGSGK